MTLKGLQACKEYSLKVAAILGREYSEFKEVMFSTAPERKQSDNLSAIITPYHTGVSAQWSTGGSLACIRNYQVTICQTKQECIHEKLGVDPTLRYLTYSSQEQLNKCTNYTLAIEPLFQGIKLKARMFFFRTLFPPLPSSPDLWVRASVETETRRVTLKWSSVECVTYYTIYQKLDQKEWEKFQVTTNYSLIIQVPLCVEINYHVTAMVNQKTIDVGSTSDPVLIEPEVTPEETVSKLNVTGMQEGALLEWKRDACITSYRVRACTFREVNKVCYEQQVINQGDKETMQLSLTNMKSCQNYKLQIFPWMGSKELISKEPVIFMTRALQRDWDLKVEQLPHRKVEITWGREECATGYRLSQRLDTETSFFEFNNTQLSIIREMPDPCTKIR